jgi:hypothetical protein
VCLARQGLQESLAQRAKPEKRVRADPRALLDFAVNQEGVGCRGFRVNLVLRVNEALLAKQGRQGKMGRTAFRAPLVRTAFLERTAKTGCLAKTAPMAKMVWMESTDNPGDRAKSAKREILALLEVSSSIVNMTHVFHSCCEQPFFSHVPSARSSRPSR